MTEDARGRAYVLRLSDDLVWSLRSTRATESWLSRFAGILGLSEAPADHSTTIRFIRRPGWNDRLSGPADPPDSHLVSELSEHGWSAQDLTVVRLWSRADRDDCVCELLSTREPYFEFLMMWQSLYPIHEKVIDRGGLPMHAALAEHRGRGVLLAGAGGTGKSTCCRRLPRPWRALSDDETIVKSAQRGEFTAHPLPTWGDFLVRGTENTWNVNAEVPVHAIFFINQSGTDQVVPLGRGESATRICHSSEEACFRQLLNLGDAARSAWRRRAFENACHIANVVPAFMLGVSPAGAFWKKMEEVLAGGPDSVI